MSDFKDRLNQVLSSKGIKPADLARLSGVNEGAISQYRKGEYEPSQRTLDKLAAALDVSASWLIGREFNTNDIDSQSESLSDRINGAIRHSGLSYGELSEITKIPKSALHRYATGETSKCPVDRIEVIAKATGVSLSYLLGWETDLTSLPSPTMTEDYVTFPVIGEIAAGYDKIAAEDWTGETVDIPISYLKGRSKDDFFVLTVSGDSMYPLYHEGDKVLILKQTTLNHPGDIGAIIYEDEKATLKRISYVPGEDWLELIPINPEFKPQRIEGEHLEHCRVIGIPRLLIREIN